MKKHNSVNLPPPMSDFPEELDTERDQARITSDNRTLTTAEAEQLITEAQPSVARVLGNDALNNMVELDDLQTLEKFGVLTPPEKDRLAELRSRLAT